MNVNARLKRIRYHGPLRPSVEVLRGLHRRHLLSVPFENLDIHLGRPIILSEAAFYDKIVKHHRGGFCYELNDSFAAFLEIVECRVARSPVTSLVKFEHQRSLDFVIRKHEFTYDTLDFQNRKYDLQTRRDFAAEVSRGKSNAQDHRLFLDNPLSDYSKNEIANSFAMSRVTFFKYWKELEKSGAVKSTRQIGRATLYQLDRGNDVVKQLIKLDLTLSRKRMERAVQEYQKPMLVKPRPH